MSEAGELRERALREADARARLAAQTEFSRPLVLEAGAGTGKTAVLVGRAVAWCLGPGWERAAVALGPAGASEASPERTASRVLERVVAITFTEAAAAEMAARVGAALVEIEAGRLPPGLLEPALPGEPGARRARARALLGSLDHLLVRTIHAFARRLLAQHPFEAGLHPAFAVDADGSALEAVVFELVERQLRRAYAPGGDPACVELAVAGFGPREIASELERLVRAGLDAEALAADPFADGRAAALAEAVAAAVEQLLAAGGERLSQGSRLKKTREALLALEALLAAARAAAGSDPAKPEAHAAMAALVAAAVVAEELALERLREWERGRFTVADSNVIGADAPELGRQAGPLREILMHTARLDPATFELARSVLAPLLGELERELRARGIETFEALLADASRLLASRPELAERIAGGIDQLLVDEFQDTDPRQCALVAVLALGARGSRPGLFIVGDPKQSIYGWRSADLAAYHAFVRRVVEAGGSIERLSVNFRSLPAILDEVERAIEPAMREEEGLQPRFEPLVAAPATAQRARDGGEPAVEYWVAWDWDAEAGAPVLGRAAETVELEARALAADILTLHRERGVAFGAIGVLFRSTGDLDRYLGALREARVPYDVERDRKYYQRREVIEAAALVRAVVDASDQSALLVWLRSSSIGVPDAALIPLWEAGLPGLVCELAGPDPERLASIAERVRGVAAALPPGLPGLDRLRGWELNVIAGLETLAALRLAWASEPGDAFVESLRRLTLVEPIEAARYLGAYRAANLDRFFRQLAAAIEAVRGDAQALLRALRRAVSEAREGEEGKPLDTQGDAVRVMTIHRAKGLDFDHVYVVQLHKEAMRTVGPSRAAGLGASGLLEYRLFGLATPGYHQVVARERAVVAAERVRTLYVAMTRAKQRLVLFGRWPELAGTAAAAPVAPGAAAGRSHMELIAASRGAPFALAEGMRTAAAAGRSDATGGGARWVFPGLISGELHALSPARREPAPWLPDADRARLGARELARQQAAARERMARPFGAIASEAGGAAPAERPARAGAQPRSAEARAIARASGSAIHRVLEMFDLRAELEPELARQRALVPSYLAGRVRPGLEAAAEVEALALYDRVASGRCLARLRALAPHVVARELPVLLPPGPGDRAVGFIAGAVDLLYRDPEADGRLVLADYKTERPGEEPLDLAERASHHAAQGRLYARAVMEALKLAAPPRLEIWFLASDAIVLLPD